MWIGALAWPAALGMLAWRMPSARAFGWIGPTVAIAMFVLLVSSDLDAASWAVADAGGSGDALPFEAFVVALADRFGTLADLDILAIEAVVAALVGSLLALACIAVVRLVAGAALAVVQAGDPVADPGASSRPARLVTVAVVLFAASLVLSRKTEGGAALIPAAVAAAWVLGSTLDEIRRRGPVARQAWSPRAALVVLAALGLGLALALQGGTLSSPDPLLVLYGLVGLVAVVLPCLVLLPDRAA
jgi:hypothetical protein